MVIGIATGRVSDLSAVERSSAPAVSLRSLLELGLICSVGHDVPVDLVSAHKWFNLAAMRGNADAVRLRREIAEQMTDSQIAQAQRAARDWLNGARRSSPQRHTVRADQRE